MSNVSVILSFHYCHVIIFKSIYFLLHFVMLDLGHIKKYVSFPPADSKSFYLNFRVKFFYFQNFGSVSIIIISVSAFYYSRSFC
jgi:hypothetical protein